MTRHTTRWSVGRQRPRPSRLAGGDQGAGHQWRRHPRRQLRAPVRESDPAEQRGRDHRDPAHPGVPHPHVRHHGRQPQAGSVTAVGDGPAVGGLARVYRLVRSTCARRRRARGRRHDGGQGGSLRHPRIGPVRGEHDGHVHGRGELRARQLLGRRWRGTPAQHAARGDRAWRRRNRAVRHSGVRDHRRVHRRAPWSAGHRSTWARRFAAPR